MKTNQVARGVRVKLNEKWEEKCLGDKHLAAEPVIFISDNHIYNDQKGEYVHLQGGSGTIGGYAYLDQLELEFPLPEGSLYPYDQYSGDGYGWKKGAIEYFLKERERIEDIIRNLDDKALLNHEIKKIDEQSL